MITSKPEGIAPCWEDRHCTTVLNDKGACPAAEAWDEGKFCFEVALGFCTRVQAAIREGGSLKACVSCDYFRKVTKHLESGEAVARLIKAKLI